MSLTSLEPDLYSVLLLMLMSVYSSNLVILAEIRGGGQLKVSLEDCFSLPCHSNWAVGRKEVEGHSHNSNHSSSLRPFHPLISINMGGIVIKSTSSTIQSPLKASASNVTTTPHLSESIPPRETPLPSNFHLLSEDALVRNFSYPDEQDYHSSSTHLFATLYNYVDLDLPSEDLQITSTSASSSTR
jgi:hypothetical protein